jgi:hypothetical protein
VGLLIARRLVRVLGVGLRALLAAPRAEAKNGVGDAERRQGARRGGVDDVVGGSGLRPASGDADFMGVNEACGLEESEVQP